MAPAAIVIAAATLAACSDQNEAARAAGYAVAPSGGEIYTGAIDLQDGTWSFKVTVPEDWRWRKWKSPDTFADQAGIEVLDPDAGPAQLEKGAGFDAPGSCTSQIAFKAIRIAADDEDTQERINKRTRGYAAAARYSGNRDYQDFNSGEAIDSGIYTGLYKQMADRRRVAPDTSVIAVHISMEWETVDLYVTSKCWLSFAEGTSLEGQSTIEDMTAFVRSTQLIPPPKP